ncbi:hypothetical protein M404DRAFT_1004452 [Pisolithus tinctorius Marx 270]|uniref:Uncharacterized protein n=1 Tax=Pisolithus tinctorius Marx 270 TaxID=870435 RepID=A0A0C3NWJ5_PISTI|nr:hypothetical protein M404DRAFT_1004452 [Pisolithus tinctorius Marx 270]
MEDKLIETFVCVWFLSRCLLLNLLSKSLGADYFEGIIGRICLGLRGDIECQHNC